MPANVSGQFSEVELELYDLLKREGGDAYSRFNALLRELISFENALDRRLTRNRRIAKDGLLH
jgi:hypothetical protein